MCSRLIVISRIRGKHAAQVVLAKDNDMVQVLAAKRPDQTFSNTILPR
jgi:hypothetical protein